MRVRFFAPLVIALFGPLAAGQNQAAEEGIRELIRKAQAAEQAEKLDQAAEAYQEILKLRPHWPAAEFNLALVYHSQKKYPEAIRLLDEVLRHDPALADAYLFLGASYYYTDQYEKAAPSLERFLKLRPGDRQVRVLLAAAYREMENYRDAARLYLEQARLTPQDGDLYYFIGQSFVELAREAVARLMEDKRAEYYLSLVNAEQAASAELAENKIRSAIKLNPNSAEAHLSLGQYYLSRGKPAQARTAFGEAAARAPGDCRPWEGTADSELALNRIEPALDAAQRALGIFPACFEMPPVRFLGLSPGEFGLRLGELRGRAAASPSAAAARFLISRYGGASWGDPAAAAGPAFPTRCETAAAARSFPSERDRLLVVASCLAARREIDKAAAALDRAQKAAPEDPKAVYWAFRTFARLADAATVKLAQIAPASPLLVKLRAQSLEQQARYDEAEAEFRRAIALAPSTADPLIEFAKYKCRLSQFDEAIPALRQALSLDPYNMRIKAQLGEIFMMKDEPEAAIPYLRDSVKANPRDRRSRMYLARALAGGEHVDEAVALLEAAPADPDGRVHYLLGRLYSQRGDKEKAARAFAIFRERKAAAARQAAQ